MKYYYLILSAVLFSIKALAQTPDTAKITVHYDFTHIRDTLNKDKPYTEKMELLVGANASVYKSYERRLRLKQMQSDMMSQIKGNPGGPQNFTVKMSGNRGTSVEYYYFPNEHKAYRKEDLVNAFIIDESPASPQWKISKDTLTIGGYHCQKATTYFKGRDYVAWFCADLPFHAGPWKLNGLPGLILQAADKKNEVVFKFDGIEKIDEAMQKALPEKPKPIAVGANSDGVVGVSTRVIGINYDQPEYLIALPEKGIKSTEKELARLKDMQQNDPQAFFKTVAASAGVSNFVINPNMTRSNAPVIVINNPLELPDQKK